MSRLSSDNPPHLSRRATPCCVAGADREYPRIPILRQLGFSWFAVPFPPWVLFAECSLEVPSRVDRELADIDTEVDFVGSTPRIPRSIPKFVKKVHLYSSIRDSYSSQQDYQEHSFILASEGKTGPASMTSRSISEARYELT